MLLLQALIAASSALYSHTPAAVDSPRMFCAGLRVASSRAACNPNLYLKADLTMQRLDMDLVLSLGVGH
jgi:hypothetical protein